MKHLILTGSIFILLSTFCFAQTDTTKFNLTSKRGFYYFPEKGDWSLSISANPFLEYLGNMIGNETVTNNYNNNYSYSYNNTNTAPSFAFTAQNPGTIYAKYFSHDNRAWRFKLLFGYSNSKDKDGSGEESSKNVYLTQKALALALSVGQEFYRPIKSRIRGYYGYEVGISSLPYKGPLYVDNTEVIGNVVYVNETMPDKEFEEEGGNTIGFNGAGILGAEWFFAPKISLGGEFGLGFNYIKQKERKYINNGNKIIVDSGGSSFNFEPYASGDLILHIYF